MILNPLGKIVQLVWEGLPGHYAGVGLDAFVVMPNHVHGVMWLMGVDEGGEAGVGVNARAGQRTAPTGGVELSTVVRGLKSYAAKEINCCRQTPGAPVWQRGYYDHIVRDDADLARIREYIANNPANVATTGWRR
ncbi:MAG: transposase [Vampirovibrio sp.]|nr:transposase [Vampirovibrio sp.]